MADESYSVVMTGKIAEGLTESQVRAKVGKVFKLGEGQLDKLFSGKPVAVRRNIDRAQADKIYAALTKAGAIASIKSNKPLAAVSAPVVKPVVEPAVENTVEPETTTAAEPETGKAENEKTEQTPETSQASEETSPAALAAKAELESQLTSAESTDESMAGAVSNDVECPRCGHQQAMTKTCGLCKMDLTLHLQRMERKQRMRAFRQQAAS